MNEEAGFLAAIAADMDSDAPRLAHADWLEKSDPPRAEFIRLQVRQARGETLPPDASGRISNLRKEHGPRWIAPRPDASGMSWRFVRGYPEEVTCTAFSAFSATWKRALVPPLRWVEFQDLRDIRRVAESPGLARVRWLRVFQYGCSDQDLQAILQSPHLADLAGLAINRGWLSGASLAALAASPNLAGLRVLDLDGSCRVVPTVEDVASFAASPHLAGLRSLHLGRWAITGEAARALWAGLWPQLETLSLAGNGLDALDLVGLGDGGSAAGPGDLASGDQPPGRRRG